MVPAVPDGRERSGAEAAAAHQTALREQYRVEVPVFGWGGRDALPRHRCVRVSAQIYNEAADYERLAEALYSLGASSAPV